MNVKRSRTSVSQWLALTVATVMPAVLPATLRAQDSSYDVPGILAWTTGKTYGFTFSPEASSGESVTRPLDGMNTRLTRSFKVLLSTQTVTVAQVVGGQPSVNQGERNTTFKMFGGRTLQPGWTVKSVDVGGNFTYVDPPRLGTSDLSFRVRLAPGGTATVRKLVLTGPMGADWKDAFSAPVRKDYVINGVVAWNAARKYGFTFKPIAAQSLYMIGEKPEQTEPADGVFTVLWIQVDRNPLYGDRCTELSAKSTTTLACIIGQVVGGNMSVTPPIVRVFNSQSVAFEMFGAKKLSPGWIVKSVTTSNGSWTRQPAYGSDDLSFVLTLTSYGSNSATAIVKSIMLEGPSNAASFEDAFKYARNPGQ